MLVAVRDGIKKVYIVYIATVLGESTWFGGDQMHLGHFRFRGRQVSARGSVAEFDEYL